jgi:hypothetical protein
MEDKESEREWEKKLYQAWLKTIGNTQREKQSGRESSSETDIEKERRRQTEKERENR